MLPVLAPPARMAPGTAPAAPSAAAGASLSGLALARRPGRTGRTMPARPLRDAVRHARARREARRIETREPVRILWIRHDENGKSVQVARSIIHGSLVTVTAVKHLSLWRDGRGHTKKTAVEELEDIHQARTHHQWLDFGVASSVHLHSKDVHVDLSLSRKN